MKLFKPSVMIIVLFTFFSCTATAFAQVAQDRPVNSLEKIQGKKVGYAEEGTGEKKERCDFDFNETLTPDFEGYQSVEILHYDPVELEKVKAANKDNPGKVDEYLSKEKEKNFRDCTVYKKKTPGLLEQKKEVEGLQETKGSNQNDNIGEIQTAAYYGPMRFTRTYMHTWFVDPPGWKINEVYTWINWYWDGRFLYSPTAGDHIWWAWQTGWDLYNHGHQSYTWWHQLWNYHTSRSYVHFTNNAFCKAATFNPFAPTTNVNIWKNEITGSWNGYSYISNGYHWYGGCWNWLSPKYDYWRTQQYV